MSKKRKEATYVQCHLQKGNMHHTAWIPKEFAILEKYIKIKKEDDTWEDGWQVKGGTEGQTKTAVDADQLSQLYKKTRKASDI